MSTPARTDFAESGGEVVFSPRGGGNPPGRRRAPLRRVASRRKAAVEHPAPEAPETAPTDSRTRSRRSPGHLQRRRPHCRPAACPLRKSRPPPPSWPPWAAPSTLPCRPAGAGRGGLSGKHADEPARPGVPADAAPGAPAGAQHARPGRPGRGGGCPPGGRGPARCRFASRDGWVFPGRRGCRGTPRVCRTDPGGRPRRWRSRVRPRR